MTALGVLCCFALFVCLTLLACFYLSSFSSLIKNMYIHVSQIMGVTVYIASETTKDRQNS